jgi:hypothetical protein
MQPMLIAGGSPFDRDRGLRLGATPQAAVKSVSLEEPTK